jgi:hypothetical protein
MQITDFLNWLWLVSAIGAGVSVARAIDLITFAAVMHYHKVERFTTALIQRWINR